MSKGGGLHQALKAMQKNAGVVRTGKKGTAEGGIDHAELRKIAEKAATFAALYGDRFEQLVQANHKRDSRFAFIARTHELHPFYQAQVNAALAEQYAQAGRGEKLSVSNASSAADDVFNALTKQLRPQTDQLKPVSVEIPVQAGTTTAAVSAVVVPAKPQKNPYLERYIARLTGQAPVEVEPPKPILRLGAKPRPAEDTKTPAAKRQTTESQKVGPRVHRPLAAGQGSDELRSIVLDTHASRRVVKETAEVLVVVEWQKISLLHFLVLPKEYIDDATQLTDADVGILQAMWQQAKEVATEYGTVPSAQKFVLEWSANAPRESTSERWSGEQEATELAKQWKPKGVIPFRLGFSSSPTRRHLHLHLISGDFRYAEDPRDWNSYTYDWAFIHPNQFISVLSRGGRIVLPSPTVINSQKSSAMVACPVCATRFGADISAARDHVVRYCPTRTAALITAPPDFF